MISSPFCASAMLNQRKLMFKTACGKFWSTFIMSHRFSASLALTKAHFPRRKVYSVTVFNVRLLHCATLIQQSTSQPVICIQYQCLDSCHFSTSPLFHVLFNVNPIVTLVYSYLVRMNNVPPQNSVCMPLWM